MRLVSVQVAYEDRYGVKMVERLAEAPDGVPLEDVVRPMMERATEDILRGPLDELEEGL